MANIDTALGAQVNLRDIAERWWALTIRGAAAIVFGVLCLVVPGLSLVVLVAMYGAFALVDGVFGLVMAYRSQRAGQRWGWFVFSGLVSLVVAGITLFMPAVTALALVLLIGAWMAVTGVAHIASAIRLRKEIQGEWLLVIIGVLSMATGVVLLLFPGAGALALVIWIGCYAIVAGVLMVALSLKLRSWARGPHRREPTEGLPTPA